MLFGLLILRPLGKSGGGGQFLIVFFAHVVGLCPGNSGPRLMNRPQRAIAQRSSPQKMDKSCLLLGCRWCLFS